MKTIFFHIPKTNGRNVHIVVQQSLQLEILRLNKQYGDVMPIHGHRGFGLLDSEDIFGYTFIREPIQRAISHWLHIHWDQPADKFTPTILGNPDHHLVNYQTKFISHSGLNIIPLEGNIENFTADINLARKRIDKLKYVFRMEDSDRRLIDNLRDILYDHLGLTKTFETPNVFPVNINPNTMKFYDSLTSSELSELEDLFKIDIELYNTINYSKV